MADSNTSLALQYPVGSSNEALRAALVRLVDVLRTVQSQQNASQEAAIEQLQGDIGDLTTYVDELVITGGGLTPQQEYEIALDHAIDTVQGSRSEWQAYIERQIINVFDAIAQLYRDQQNDSAAITVEQIVRVSDTEAFAQQITALTADLATTSAAVVTEQTARANGDSALASDITAVTSTANGNTTSISTLASSVDGISANWTVALNTNDRVTGMVTLNGIENTSSFSVLADKFQIVHPTDDGKTVTAFTTGLVDGVSTVGMSGSVIIDGTLLARHIAAETITSAQIAAGGIDADRLNVTQLDAISATIGTLRTATSGARTEIKDNVIKVYDSSNVLRVKIGDLSL